MLVSLAAIGRNLALETGQTTIIIAVVQGNMPVQKHAQLQEFARRRLGADVRDSLERDQVAILSLKRDAATEIFDPLSLIASRTNGAMRVLMQHADGSSAGQGEFHDTPPEKRG